jgi:hypothetical protein
VLEQFEVGGGQVLRNAVRDNQRHESPFGSTI